MFVTNRVLHVEFAGIMYSFHRFRANCLNEKENIRYRTIKRFESILMIVKYLLSDDYYQYHSPANFRSTL